MGTAQATIKQVLFFLSLSDLIYPCVFICCYFFRFVRPLFFVILLGLLLFKII
jgi:hypothetical protein